jgi:tRNA threonylcarbamoyladenosine biosynthesis protein TsaB
MSKILRIDTSNNKIISLELDADIGKDELTEDSTFLRSELALPAIERLIERNNLKIQDIERIEVNKGPGSFTGLRVGIAIANALGFLLKIPVNGKKVGELEEPVYNE